MTERETETRALAGPLVNARATSAGVAPWAPIPGRRSTARGISLRASATARGYVAPTTAPTLERPRLPTRPAPQSFTSWAVWYQSGRPSDMVTSWRSALPALVVLTRQKTPVPERLQAAMKEIGRAHV